jgi:hypothetical protein
MDDTIFRCEISNDPSMVPVSDLYRQQNYNHDAHQIIIAASYGAISRDKLLN